MCSNGNTYGNKLNCFSNYYYDRVGEWVSCELFERFSFLVLVLRSCMPSQIFRVDLHKTKRPFGRRIAAARFPK